MCATNFIHSFICWRKLFFSKWGRLQSHDQLTTQGQGSHFELLANYNFGQWEHINLVFDISILFNCYI